MLNSSHYICLRLGYHVYCVMNCTTFITKNIYFYASRLLNKLKDAAKNFMCNKKTVLFIYFENIFSSCIVAIHFLGSLASVLRVVFGSSLSTPLPICVQQIKFCTEQSYPVLLNNF